MILQMKLIELVCIQIKQQSSIKKMHMNAQLQNPLLVLLV